jgi:hypothetical protein
MLGPSIAKRGRCATFGPSRRRVMSTAPEKIRVLLVDYDAVTQAGIAAMLSSGSIAEVVGLAAGVADFPQKFRPTLPKLS